MSDVLTLICEHKRDHVAARKKIHPPDRVEAAAREAAPPRGFIASLKSALDTGGYGLIAEIKRASPSKGLIREDFDPGALARAYEAGGAACLSVLTDLHFKGNDADLIDAWSAVDLPVLRKDFIIDPYQIAETRALGADCVLLILAALTDPQAEELESAAVAFGLDVLLEVHDRDELARALKLKSPLIGINNRNLKTFDVDLSVTESLVDGIPTDKTVVSESGISTAEDLARLSKAGVHCFLVGSALMAEDDVEAATRALLAQAEPENARA